MYKVGDKITIREWFTDYEGIVTKIGKSIMIVEANGHQHWKYLDTNGEILSQ